MKVELVHCTPDAEWRPILGYEGLYEVSSEGFVRSCDRDIILCNGKHYKRSGKILAFNTKKGKHPYKRVKLCRDGIAKLFLVSRLVLSSFDRPPKDSEQACHCNGNPSDNNLSNLRWDSVKGNFLDRYLHGTAPIGENGSTAKLKAEDIFFIRGYSGRLVDLAEHYGVTAAHISSIRLRKSWKHLA